MTQNELQISERTERRISICKWQSRCEQGLKGKWTISLIPHLTSWLENENELFCYIPNSWLIMVVSGILAEIWSWRIPNMAKLHSCEWEYYGAYTRFRWLWQRDSMPSQLCSVVSNAGDQWCELCRQMCEAMLALRRLQMQRRNLMCISSDTH